jgi:hypothetical protein
MPPTNIPEATANGLEHANDEVVPARSEAEALTKMLQRYGRVRVTKDAQLRPRSIVVPSDIRVGSVLRNLPVLEYVEEIDVSSTFVREGDLEQLVLKCPNIRILDITDCTVSAAWAAEILRRLNRLECLIVTVNDEADRRGWDRSFGDVVLYEGKPQRRPCEWKWRSQWTMDPAVNKQGETGPASQPFISR